MRRAERLREAVRPTYLRLRQTAAWAQYPSRNPDSEAKIERDAQRFWESKSRHLPQLAHWRGAGVFADDARWLAWGRGHLDLYRDFARMLDAPLAVQSHRANGDREAGPTPSTSHPSRRNMSAVEVTQANLERERPHARRSRHPQLRARAHQD